MVDWRHAVQGKEAPLAVDTESCREECSLELFDHRPEMCRQDARGADLKFVRQDTFLE